MKIYYKIFLIALCISLFPLSAGNASIRDNTYVVYIWTPVSTSLLNPRWVDQFEFDSGDVFRAYTTKEAQLAGTWIETPLGLSSWFQAFVEKPEETTTTTSEPGENGQTSSQGKSLSRCLEYKQKGQ